MSRILLLLDHRENRRLLMEALSSRGEVIIPETDEVIDGDYDLCFIDGPALERLWQRVEARKHAESPIFLPFLLVTARPDVGLATRHLWHSVDELITTPIERIELQARVEILLRARQASLQVETERLAFQTQTREVTSILENIDTAIMITDREGRILSANTALARMVRRPLPSLIGKSLVELTGITIEDPWRQRAWEQKRRTARHGVRITFPFAPERGATYWDIVVLPILQLDGQVGSVLSAYTEVSEYVIARQTVEEERAGLRTILETLPVGVFITDEVGGIISANAASRRIWGGPIPDVLSINGYKIFTGWRTDNGNPVDPEEWAAARAIRQGATTLDDEADIQRFDGVRGTILNSATPLRDETGRITGAIWVMQDITIRKQAQLALQESEKRLQLQFEELNTLYQYTPVALFVLDKDLNYLRANERLAETNGVPLEEHVGHSLYDVLPRGMIEGLQQVWAPVFEKGEPVLDVEVTGQTAKLPGIQRYWLASYFPLKSETGEVIAIAGAVQDITERKRIEAERERLLAEMDATLAGIADGLIIYTPEGEIARMNDAARELLGFTEEECHETVFHRWAHRHLTTPDRQLFPLEQLPVYRALQGERIQGVVMVVDCPPAGRVVWVSASAGPIFGPENQLLGVVANYADITPVHALQEQLKILLQTVSHDLRAPLAVIKGHEQVVVSILQEQGLNGMILQSMAAIERSVNRMDLMIQDLVDVTQWEGGQLTLKCEAVDFPQYLEDFLQRVSMALETTRVQVEMPADLPPISADYARLERILTNLLSNALKYSEPGTPVWMNAWTQDDTVIISVTDQGKGIPPEAIPHLFERFYRIPGERKAEGIGLGLYITKILVEAHGGRIWVESEPEKGSTFFISLPIAPTEDRR